MVLIIKGEAQTRAIIKNNYSNIVFW